MVNLIAATTLLRHRC